MSDRTANSNAVILWLVKGLGPGGAERLLVDHARFGDHERFSYQAAYLLPHKDHLTPDLERWGVTTHCLDARGLRTATWPWHLRRLLARERVDVLHAHSPYPASLARLVVRTLRSDRRPAVFYTEHNVWSRHSSLTRLANRLTYPLDDAHVAVSDGVRDSVGARLREGVDTLVHGIDVQAVARLGRERPAIRAELGVAADVAVIGTVANLRVSKGYEHLLRAARRVLDDHPEVIFVTVGQGPLETELRRLHARLGLGDRFRFLGYRPDAVRVASAFDVFVLPSLHEGLPIALLEAMALGIPSVVTQVGGVPEVVTDGVEGVFVPAGSPAALAESVAALIDDPDARVRMGAAAGKRAEQFDIAPAVRELERRYRDLAARRTTAPRRSRLRWRPRPRRR